MGALLNKSPGFSVLHRWNRQTHSLCLRAIKSPQVEALKCVNLQPALQVKKLFRQCRIVGKRFPIAHVTLGDDLLEVSSFCTRADRDLIPPDAAALLGSKARCLFACNDAACCSQVQIA